MASVFRRIAAAGISAAAARACISYIHNNSERFSAWDRAHSDGSPVSLTEGIAASAGVLAGAIACVPGKAKIGALISVLSAATAGYIDDHKENDFEAQSKGFAGHLGALKEGKLTSGTVKIFIVGTGAVLGSLFLERTGVSRLHRVTQWGAQSVLIAGSANLINLLDLRPGRAIKAGGAAVSPSLFSSNPVHAAMGAVCLGTGVACAPEDLRGETMLGDMGANAFGAGLGVAIASVQNPIIRLLALGDVLGLTLLSEKYSFTEIIEDTPWLNRLDQLGRS